MRIWTEIKWFFRQCKRSFGYAKKAWGGYDWDYRYSVDMFTYSLERLADNLDSSESYCVGSEQRAKRIRTAIKLMNKVYNEDYALEYQDKLKELYGEKVNDINFVDEGEVSSYNGEPLYIMQWEYEKWDNAEEVEEVKNKLFIESYNKHERAHKLVWQLIEKDIRSWWD